MKPKLTLYSRKDCCLCDEMKAVLREVAEKVPIELEESDVDASIELREKFGDEVPVLFIDGKKAFKYRVTARELEKKLGRVESVRSIFRFSRREQ
jgi:glutaredoxin